MELVYTDSDTVAFHSGYYIKEIMEENVLTQEDFIQIHSGLLCFMKSGILSMGIIGYHLKKNPESRNLQLIYLNRDSLIPRDKYNEFIANKRFALNDVVRFAEAINRDSGIVLGRL